MSLGTFVSDLLGLTGLIGLLCFLKYCLRSSLKFIFDFFLKDSLVGLLDQQKSCDSLGAFL